MAIFETIGVGAILPFLALVSDPGLADSNPLLRRYCDMLGLQSREARLIGIGAGLVALIMTGMLVRVLVTYMQFRFCLMRACALGARLLQGHLSQDHLRQIGRNGSDLGSAILSEVDTVVRESILPAVLLISNGLAVALIATLVFLVAPGVALGLSLLLAMVFLGVYALLRHRLAATGLQRLQANRARFRAVQEITGGSREIRLLGLERRSLARFHGPARSMAETQTAGQVMSRLPRFVLEAVVYGGFVALVLGMSLRRGADMAELLPLFGLLGMAATRLFPAMQSIYQCLSQIRLSRPSLDRIGAQLAAAGPPPPDGPAPAPLPLEREIALEAVHFRYPGQARAVLDGVSLRIPARGTVGVVGGTEAGKTTLIDLILGLIAPGSGRVCVDGAPIGAGNLRAWQRNVGYVPQHIFLLDDSIAANIAFGEDVPDMAAVERAARIAALHEFVRAELPHGYATRVGERGVRLSGGQRQRIGIARALYRDPDVLILDEATSALDTVTERAVMAAVHRLSGRKTVILIAHRLSTVKGCDSILLMQGGRIVAQGPYATLIDQSPDFRRLAHA
ncbi:MAG: ABC transporter ATP-binding protein [Limimaricola sp.]